MNVSSDLLYPIVISGSGRSGTSLLMQLLGSDERCVFPRSHSFEERYLAHMLRFAGLFDGIDLASINDVKDNVSSVLGIFPNLQPEHDQQFAPSLNAADFCSVLWLEFSKKVKLSHPGAHFYAEKLPTTAMLGRVPFDNYTIFLFRDPRDVLLSAEAFMKKHNLMGFGREFCRTRDEFARAIAASFAETYENSLCKIAPMSCSVRYEDLIQDPAKALSQLTESTGITIENRVSNEFYEYHRTTANLQTSTQRWKTEKLEADLLFAFDANLSTELSALNYPIRKKGDTVAETISFANGNQPIIEITGGSEHCSPAGMRLKLQQPVCKIKLQVQLNAPCELIPEIWICSSGQDADYLTVGWQSTDGKPVDPIVANVPKGLNYNVTRVVMDNHPSWHGSVKELELSVVRLKPTSDEGEHIVRWIRFVLRSPQTFCNDESDPSTGSGVLPDSASMARLEHELQHHRIIVAEQANAIKYLSNELHKTIDVVDRLKGHATHLENQRDYFRSRWTRLTDLVPVRNLFALRNGLRGLKRSHNFDRHLDEHF
jgi:hypothetical protein